MVRKKYPSVFWLTISLPIVALIYILVAVYSAYGGGRVGKSCPFGHADVEMTRFSSHQWLGNSRNDTLRKLNFGVCIFTFTTVTNAYCHTCGLEYLDTKNRYENWVRKGTMMGNADGSNLVLVGPPQYNPAYPQLLIDFAVEFCSMKGKGVLVIETQRRVTDGENEFLDFVEGSSTGSYQEVLNAAHLWFQSRLGSEYIEMDLESAPGAVYNVGRNLQLEITPFDSTTQVLSLSKRGELR